MEQNFVQRCETKVDADACKASYLTNKLTDGLPLASSKCSLVQAVRAKKIKLSQNVTHNEYILYPNKLQYMLKSYGNVNFGADKQVDSPKGWTPAE